jgi:glutamine synthetase
LFESNHVLTHVELEARHEIELEKYIKKVQIEGRIMGELCTSHIVPSAVKYMNVLINNITGLKEVGIPESGYSNQKTDFGTDRRTY